MLLNINTVLIIILYHWTTICTCQVAKRKRLPDQSNSDDCSIEIPDKNDLNSPIPYITVTEPQSTSILGRNGHNWITNTHLNIKHNSSFKLACPIGKNKRDESGEVEVKCVKGSLEYKGQPFDIKDIKCEGPEKNSANRRELYDKEGKYLGYTIEAIKTKSQRSSSKDCFFWVPYKDYNMPIPYEVKSTNPQMLRPDHTGNLWVPHGKFFKLSCVNRTFQRPIDPDTHEITVSCSSKTLLRYRGKVFDFDRMRCNRVPNPSMNMLQKTCQDTAHRVITIGFRTKSTFLGLYRVCIDMERKDSLYAWYTVATPYFNNRQIQSSRPIFVKTEVYGDMDMDGKYKSQEATISKLLQSRTLANKYINMTDGSSFLSRGHLMSRIEFNYAFEQDATFFYENTTPMWQDFNVGIWKDVEKVFKRTLSRGFGKRLVMTGTYGHCTLPDIHNKQTPLYLSLPDSLKVPLFIWRLDYDLIKKTGVVYIALNHVYMPVNDKKLIICEPINCPGPLLRNNYKIQTLLYCCSKESFEKVYGELDPFVYEQFR